MSFEKSNLRKKLFLYFFTNPERRHYLREIANILEVDPTNLSRELRRLENEGVFLSQKSGHQKYFLLNTNYQLFNEFKSAVNKTIGIPEQLKGVLASIPGIKRAFIYGSFAKGTQNVHSDVDVCLIVRKKKFQEEKLLSDFKFLEKKLGREISYNFHTEEEWAEGLKRKDSFIFGVEKGKKIELIASEQD